MLGITLLLIVTIVTIIIFNKKPHLKEKYDEKFLFNIVVLTFFISVIISYFTYTLPLKYIYDVNEVYHLAFFSSFIFYFLLLIFLSIAMYFILNKHIFEKTPKKNYILIVSICIIMLFVIWIFTYDFFFAIKDNLILINPIHNIGCITTERISDIVHTEIIFVHQRNGDFCFIKILFKDNFTMKSLTNDVCDGKTIKALIRISKNLSIGYAVVLTKTYGKSKSTSKIESVYHLNGIVFNCREFPCKVVLILNASKNCYDIARKFNISDTILLCSKDNSTYCANKILGFLKANGITNEKNMLIIGE